MSKTRGSHVSSGSKNWQRVAISITAREIIFIFTLRFVEDNFLVTSIYAFALTRSVKKRL